MAEITPERLAELREAICLWGEHIRGPLTRSELLHLLDAAARGLQHDACVPASQYADAVTARDAARAWGLELTERVAVLETQHDRLVAALREVVSATSEAEEQAALMRASALLRGLDAPTPQGGG